MQFNSKMTALISGLKIMKLQNLVIEVQLSMVIDQFSKST